MRYGLIPTIYKLRTSYRKYSPITSSEAERSFSLMSMRRIKTYTRCTLMEIHIYDQAVISMDYDEGIPAEEIRAVASQATIPS